MVNRVHNKRDKIKTRVGARMGERKLSKPRGRNEGCDVVIRCTDENGTCSAFDL